MRETLHIMDDTQRIALVETRTRGDEPTVPRELIRYQLTNHLGSASLELDDQARVLSYEEYTPYGSTAYQAVRSQIQTPKRYRFTGMERDEESGLSYHAARYYAPWLGRWLNVDPEAIQNSKAEEGASKPRIELLEAPYRYADANPVAFVDPSGREPVTNVFNRLVRKLATKGATKQAAKAATAEMKKVGTRVASNIGQEGIPAHTLEHIALHFTRDATEKATHTVFTKSFREAPSKLTDAIQKTLRKPSVTPHLSVTDTGHFAIVFERNFRNAVGDSGEQMLRVVVDHQAKLISAFPVKEASTTVTKSGVKIAAGRAVLPSVALAFAGASEARAAHEESERKIHNKLTEGHWTDWILPDFLVASPLADGTLAPARRREAAFESYAQAALHKIEDSQQRSLAPEERENLRGILKLAWDGL